MAWLLNWDNSGSKKIILIPLKPLQQLSTKRDVEQCRCVESWLERSRRRRVVFRVWFVVMRRAKRLKFPHGMSPNGEVSLKYLLGTFSVDSFNFMSFTAEE